MITTVGVDACRADSQALTPRGQTPPTIVGVTVLRWVQGEVAPGAEPSLHPPRAPTSGEGGGDTAECEGSGFFFVECRSCPRCAGAQGSRQGAEPGGRGCTGRKVAPQAVTFEEIINLVCRNCSQRPSARAPSDRSVVGGGGVHYPGEGEVRSGVQGTTGYQHIEVAMRRRVISPVRPKMGRSIDAKETSWVRPDGVNAPVPLSGLLGKGRERAGETK